MKIIVAIAILSLGGVAHAKRTGYARGEAVRQVQANIGMSPDGVRMPLFMIDGIMGPRTVRALLFDQRQIAREVQK